ncbi:MULTISPECIES: restriction endonuclease subunit S [Corynebacterium]|uniref:restriction endonuclease subunit S n=2 Tax=Corynebacteriaceae TaxID=1653 RepID=UPI000A41B40E|nr:MULTISPECIES: restriction endonuclease subunit S [Corynebacterium]MCQ9677257.1 restriction endonuclease subunit S [Corynebacterium sp. BF-R-2]MDK8898779.1 restriction endonuclease subunit S [Corynebacterium sp. MSK004]
MQRMFPQEEGQTVPELRLEGFDGEWKTTTLGELGSFKSGVGFPEREQGGEAGLPFYKVSDLSAPGNELQLRSANHYVTEEQIVRNHWVPVTAVPAILFAKVGAAVFLGRKRLATDTFLLDNNLMAFSLDTKSWDVQFADTYLKTVDLTRFTQSGALPSLNARHLAEAAATIPPTLEEQQAIGAVFTRLDTLIATEAKYIESLKQAKAALLQRMFI